MTALLLLLALQFTPLTDRRPGVVLEGHWQSCPDSDGSYLERVYDHLTAPSFELHLGPRDEFALFRYPQTDDDHSGAANLLGPSYHFNDVDSLTGRNWTVYFDHTKLWLNVRKGGGSNEQCESYLILLTKTRLP